MQILFLNHKNFYFSTIKNVGAGCRWLTPVILLLRRQRSGRSQYQPSLSKIVHKTLSQKTHPKKDWWMPSRCEVLSSNPSATKKKKQRKKENWDEIYGRGIRIADVLMKRCSSSLAIAERPAFDTVKVEHYNTPPCCQVIREMAQSHCRTMQQYPPRLKTTDNVQSRGSLPTYLPERNIVYMHKKTSIKYFQKH
jgi:hypothetical protein